MLKEMITQCWKTYSYYTMSKMCLHNVWRHVSTIFENKLTQCMNVLHTIFEDLFVLCFKVCYVMCEDMFIQCFKHVYTKLMKLGVFSKCSKYSFLVAFISQLVKKLQQWSLYEVIEVILPFVLHTKRPLSDIWLLSYKQNSFGKFLTKVRISIGSKNTKNWFLYNSATKYRLKAVLY